MLTFASTAEAGGNVTSFADKSTFDLTAVLKKNLKDHKVIATYPKGDIST